jgi:thioredoxin reductase (NADPH)
MEARVCIGDPVVVVGGGNSAGQATVSLSRFTDEVRLVVREHDLTEHMSRYLADRIERSDAVEVLYHSEVREAIGEDALEALVVVDNDTGERRTVAARALFVFIGAEPHTDWLDGQLALDDGGYVLTGPAARDDALMLETSRPGVFAAGDVRSGCVQRVASAVGEGALAIRLVHQRLAGRPASGQFAQAAGQLT